MSKIYIGEREIDIDQIGEKYYHHHLDLPAAAYTPIVEHTENIIEQPPHYTFGSIEPIDVIEDWRLDFRLANTIKYIARAGKKEPDKKKQDLEKALWYLKRYIDKECNND